MYIHYYIFYITYTQFISFFIAFLITFILEKDNDFIQLTNKLIIMFIDMIFNY